MAGVKGAKQKQQLSKKQIDEIVSVAAEISANSIDVSQKSLVELSTKYGISYVTLRRRWNTSQRDVSLLVYYDWEQYVNGEVPKKGRVRYECLECKATVTVSKIAYRTWEDGFEKKLCTQCLLTSVWSSNEWSTQQSMLQFEAQNRPAVKKKMSESVKRAWKRDYEERCESIRRSYTQNPEHKKRISAASRRVWLDPEYREKQEKTSAYRWGYWSGIFYQSLCELAFLLWANDEGHTVERSKHLVRYYDTKGQARTYRPDFVLNRDTLIEVKSSLRRERDLGRYDEVQLKLSAASNFCKANSLKLRLVETNVDIPSRYYKQARRIHHGEAQIEANFPLSGKSA